MKEIKVQAYSNYVLGEYRHRTDEKNVSNFTKEQIMATLGKSKEYSYTDWFGSTYDVTFTITNIEEGKYGYIYILSTAMRTFPIDSFRRFIKSVVGMLTSQHLYLFL